MYSLTSRLIAIAFCLLSGMVQLHGKIIPQQLTIEKVQGLPQTDYYETAQDAQGFIYFATDLGLLRYDGQRVIHLSDIGILRNKSVFSVRAFKNGNLLIFVKDQGYFLYRQNKFYPFKINSLVKSQPALSHDGHAVYGNNFITSNGKEVYINSAITLKSNVLTQQQSGAVSTFLLNGQSINLPSDNTIPNIIKKGTGFTPIPKSPLSTNMVLQTSTLAATKANTLFFKIQNHTTKIELPCKPFHIFIDNANNLWITHGANGVSKSISNAISFYDFPLEISQVSHFDSFFVLGNGYKLFKTNDFTKYSIIQGQPPREIGLQNLNGAIYFKSGELLINGDFKRIQDYPSSKFAFLFKNRFYYATHKAINYYSFSHTFPQGIGLNPILTLRFPSFVNQMLVKDSILYLSLVNSFVTIDLNSGKTLKTYSIKDKILDMKFLEGRLYYLTSTGIFDLEQQKKPIFNLSILPLSHVLKLDVDQKNLFVLFNDGLVILKKNRGRFFCDGILQTDDWKVNSLTNFFFKDQLYLFNSTRVFTLSINKNNKVNKNGLQCFVNGSNTSATSISLKYGESLNVSVSPLNYEDSKLKEFLRYRIIRPGLKSFWQYSASKDLVIAGLSPGCFKLELSMPFQSQSIGELEIIITEPFYKSTAFYFGFAILAFILFSALGYYKYRLNVSKNVINEVKLKTLSISLRPHMIFNYLNGIQSLFIRGKYELAESYLEQFNTYLRYSFYNYQSEFTYLNEDLDNTLNFLELEKKRQPKLKFHFFNVAELNLSEYKVPPMLFQPLVENSIKHASKHGDISIDISVFEKSHNSVVIQIKDYGPGFHSSEVKEGHGLSTVIQIIEIFNRRNPKSSISIDYNDSQSNGASIIFIISK